MAHHVSKRRKVDHQPRHKDADANAEQAGSANALEDMSAKRTSSRQDSKIAGTTAGRSFGHSVTPSNLQYNRLHGRGARVTSGKSSLTRLEIDELLSKLEAESQGCMATAESTFSKLKSVIEAIPAREALPACVPFSLNKPDKLRVFA